MSARFWTAGLLIGVALLGAGLAAADTTASAPATGPTPYPTDNKAWPGKGPIRKFGWMDDNRKYFWKGREAAQNAVVFCGDSLTGNWKDLAKAFPELKVANRGIGGDTSRGLLFRFSEDVLDLHPKAVVLLVGTNDLTAMGKPADAASNIADMLDLAEKQMPGMPVILCTTPPSANAKAPVALGQRQALNAEIAKLAAVHKAVTLCDLYAAMADGEGAPRAEFFGEDKLHLSAAGYAKWVETIKPLLDKLDLKGAGKAVKE